MAADNNRSNPFILLKSLEFTHIPTSLAFIFFRGQAGKVRVDQDQPDVFPDKAIPSPAFKMRETSKIVVESPLVVAIKLMIPQDWKTGDFLLAPRLVQIVKVLPVFL